jgi:hypothetical protein
MTNHAHAAKSIIVVHYILHFFFNARALEDLAGQKNFILIKIQFSINEPR